MKRLSLFTLLVVIYSCDSDDAKKQSVTGEISGKSWTHNDGYAIVDENAVLSITLLQDDRDLDGCDLIFSSKGDRLWFRAPNKEGLYIFTTESDVDHEAWLYEESTYMGHPFTDGEIEILKVTSTQIKGRVRARLDDENFVEGNFTVAKCEG